MAGDTIRLGLIGAGPWGRNLIRTVAATDGVALARLASRNPEAARLAGPGCRVSRDWREVAEAPDIEGVIVATPPALHAEMAAAAIDAGLAVMVEKPLTLDLSEARELLARAEAGGAFVIVDHVHLYSPAFRALKALAAGLGPPRAIRAEAGGPGPVRRDTPVLWDWGAHDVALCLDLLGARPETVAARRVEGRADGKGETIAIDLGFPGGIAAKIALSNRRAEKRRYFEVRYDAETLVYDDRAPAKLTRRHPGADPEPVAIADTPPLSAAVAAFANGIRAGSRDLGDLRLAVDVVAVLADADAALAGHPATAGRGEA